VVTRGRGPDRGVCWFAAVVFRCVQERPLRSGRIDSGAWWAVCSLRVKDKRARLSCLLHEGSVPPVRRTKLPNRGVREMPIAGAGCPRGSANAKDRSAADTARTVPEKQDVLAACAGSVHALGRRDCEAVRLLSTQIVCSTGESNFISNDTALWVQRRRQRFPTVRTVTERGNGEYEAKSNRIRACTSTAVCKPSWTLMI
jgi:hypothetical protein